MKTLGIIGSDNSHSYSIANVCNILKKVPLRVTHISGESEESARASAERGAIPHVVCDWHDLLGKVDGVMIDHRAGWDHFASARFFIENKVPTFIDKPLTCDLAQAKELLTLAARKKTPVCSFGLIPLQTSFRKFIATVRKTGTLQAVNTTGPADFDSPYGGISFYGFHQIDAIVELLGTEAKSATIQRNGRNGTGTILFSGSRIATVNFIAEGGDFHWMATTDQGVASSPHRYDEIIYLASCKALAKFLNQRETPWSRSRMLAPIAILEALQNSLKSGKTEKVAKV